MEFSALRRFISHEMSMSHIYQPVVIRALLEHGGEISIREIAREFLSYDEAQISYYIKVAKRWPQVTLKKHGIINTVRRGYFKLTLDIASLSSEQKLQLIDLCNQKIREYIENYKGLIGDYRYNPEDLSSSSIRYQVLKLANGRCALCGASKEDTPIDIDHIKPKVLGGKNDISNLQALCYRCNRAKRARDSQDFRSYGINERMKDCPFCNLQSRIMDQYCTAVSILDAFPVTPGHTLVIPKRHVESLHNLSLNEIGDLFSLGKILKAELHKNDGSITGFNWGINEGSSAGQTINHLHMHLIPRRQGDVSEPRGGIRNIIPGKGPY